MSANWDWGIFFSPPLRQHHLPRLDPVRPEGHCAAVNLCLDYRLSGGILFGILRTVPNKFLSSLGTIYVEIFRNVPLIVQFFTVSGDPGVPAVVPARLV